MTSTKKFTADFDAYFRDKFNGTVLERFVFNKDVFDSFNRRFGFFPFSGHDQLSTRVDKMLDAFADGEVKEIRDKVAILYAKRDETAKNMDDYDGSLDMMKLSHHLVSLAEELESKHFEIMRGGLVKEMDSLNVELVKLKERTAPIVDDFIDFVKTTIESAADAGLKIDAYGFDQWTGEVMSGYRTCVATSNGISVPISSAAVKKAHSLAIPWVYLEAKDYKGAKVSIYLGNPYNSVKFPKSSYHSVNQFTVLRDTFEQGHKLSRWAVYVKEHKAKSSGKLGAGDHQMSVG